MSVLHRPPAGLSSRRRRSRRALETAMLLAAIAASLLAGTAAKKPQGQAPVPVLTAVVRSEAVPLTLPVVGNVEPIESVALKAQVGGMITRVGFKEGEEVFSERRSLLFKRLHVVRFSDKARNVLVYLAYSDKIVEGSPKNSVSAVPIMPWPGAAK